MDETVARPDDRGMTSTEFAAQQRREGWLVTCERSGVVAGHRGRWQRVWNQDGRGNWSVVGGGPR